MSIRDSWSILGIEPTNNQRAIKKAYATMSRKYHPEDSPEEFNRIKEAYEEAMAVARKSIPEHEGMVYENVEPPRPVLIFPELIIPEPFTQEQNNQEQIPQEQNNQEQIPQEAEDGPDFFIGTDDISGQERQVEDLIFYKNHTELEQDELTAVQKEACDFFLDKARWLIKIGDYGKNSKVWNMLFEQAELHYDLCKKNSANQEADTLFPNKNVTLYIFNNFLYTTRVTSTVFEIFMDKLFPKGDGRNNEWRYILRKCTSKCVDRIMPFKNSRKADWILTLEAYQYIIRGKVINVYLLLYGIITVCALFLILIALFLNLHNNQHQEKETTTQEVEGVVDEDVLNWLQNR